MVNQLNHPLGVDHYNALTKVLESITPALELAAACTQCGWDMSEYTAELKRQQEQATRAKALFFPNRP